MKRKTQEEEYQYIIKWIDKAINGLMFVGLSNRKLMPDSFHTYTDSTIRTLHEFRDIAEDRMTFYNKENENENSNS